MVNCNLCGKTFKNTQGLRGHRNFVHPDTDSNVRQPVNSPAAQVILESTGGSHTPEITDHRLSEVEQQLTSCEERLESIDGQLEQLSTRSQNVAQYIHCENDTLLGQVAELNRRVSALERFVSEYSELLRDLKVIVRREQTIRSCAHKKWSMSDVLNKCLGTKGPDSCRIH